MSLYPPSPHLRIRCAICGVLCEWRMEALAERPVYAITALCHGDRDEMEVPSAMLVDAYSQWLDVYNGRIEGVAFATKRLGGPPSDDPPPQPSERA